MTENAYSGILSVWFPHGERFMRKGCEIMTNTNMLVSKMKLFGDNQQDLADALNLSLVRTNAKINNKDGAKFDQNEMNIMRIKYNLTDCEFVQIFCADIVPLEGTLEDEQ